ncbi:MAG TPA: hypothetical protein DCW93_02055 [Saprospirales bacterium]|nr:hypothetical protein [Saprospirales bacterium]
MKGFIMGFFSWKTQDTDKSIANSSSSRDTFVVRMTDNQGNSWVEDQYEGYGEFGGMDYYELLAKMNGLKDRDDGISLALNEEGIKFLAPNLNEYECEWTDSVPENCEDQGYFYCDEEEDEEDDEW